MRQFANLCENIASTTKKLEKTALVSEYFKPRLVEEAATAAVFLSGRPFPMWEETTLQVGGSLLWRVIAELSGKNEAELHAAYRQSGDLGSVAADVLPTKVAPDVSLLRVQQEFRNIAAARGPGAKAALVRGLIAELAPLEAKYIIKIMTGDLRVGLKESLVEEAIAKAYGAPLVEVQRANMLLGDIGETLRYAVEAKLGEAHMRLFHPLGFMLASPAASAAEAMSYFADARVEDKYDGIRAQAHCSSGEARIFSRTRDEITESFPEIAEALSCIRGDAILDGEIVAWSYLAEAGRALPFSALQKRLGRKKVTQQIMQSVPVAYLVFDALYAKLPDSGGLLPVQPDKSDKSGLLIDRPLRERAEILEKLLGNRTTERSAEQSAAVLAQPMRLPSSPARAQSSFRFRHEDEPDITTQIIRAPVFYAAIPEELDALFEAAQARGNEGLMIKDPESTYTPGRRGKSWLKLKRELATLDVVVTAVEYGHGKRIGVLSDYTFAVWDEDHLVNIGKAYSGLTDTEITEMTQWFLGHTVEDQGLRLVVEPKIVLEVAFNNMMRSERHGSGYALRFPRIVRLRPDKLAEEADTIKRVKEIFQKQK